MFQNSQVLTLTVLTALTRAPGNPRVLLESHTLCCDDEPLKPYSSALSEAGYVARVRRLANKLGLPEINVPRLADCWRAAFQGGEVITKERLVELARAHACPRADLTEPLARWRHAFEARLHDACPALSCVEHLSPGAPAPDAKQVLELAPLSQHWPEQLLKDPGWAYAESPFGSLQPMPLDDVWVDIHFVDLAESDPLSPGASLREFEDLRYKQRQALAVPPQFVVEAIDGLVALTGGPGVGKTTFVKWLARQLVKQADGRFLLPLVVPLRRYATADHHDGLLSFAIRQCGVRSQPQVRLWEETLSHLAGTGRDTVLLLLDGWDEVPEHRREAIRHEIDTLRHGFTIVITSRPSAYPRAWLPADRFYEITDLSPESITELVTQWFHSVRQGNQAIDLLEHLDAHPDLRGLARNPFLLTIVCGIAYNSHETERLGLPTTRTELYQRTVEHIQAAQSRRNFTPERLRETERLALWLLISAPDAPRFVFNRDDVRQCCGSTDLLTEVLQPSRLLSQWDYDRETLHFIHTTFHEYLAAARLASPEFAAEARGLIDEHVHDMSWQEVLRFLAGTQSDFQQTFWATVSKVLESPDRFGFVLARFARLVRETHVQPEDLALLKTNLREELWSRIQKGVEPDVFVEACIELDADWFVDRVQSTLCSEQDSIPSWLAALLVRAAKRARTRSSSEMLLRQILTGVDQQAAIASYLDPRGLRVQEIRVLQERASDNSLSLVVRRRIFRALGEVRAHESVRLLAGAAREGGPLAKDALSALAEIGGHRACDALAVLLSHAAQSPQRVDVLNALGNARQPRARDQLLEELSGSSVDEEDTDRVLCALQENPVGKDVPIVIDCLQMSSSASVRASAAWVLLDASGPGIADAVARAAQEDPDEEVRFAALAALRSHVRPADVGWLESLACDPTQSPKQRTKSLEALLTLVDRYRFRRDFTDVAARVEQIVQSALDSPTEDLALEAASRAHLLGESIGNRLAKLCIDAAAWSGVREAACNSLGRIRYRPGAESLLSLVRAAPNSRSDEAKTVTAVPERLANAAAAALAHIDPYFLLPEDGQTAQNALARFAVENGCLVFADHIVDAHGRRLVSPLTPELPAEHLPGKPAPGLSPRAAKAHASYELAARALGEFVEDKDAYQWLREHGPGDYELPPFRNWSRYLREGRHWHGTQKNRPLAGRSGRSIIRSRDDDLGPGEG